MSHQTLAITKFHVPTKVNLCHILTDKSAVFLPFEPAGYSSVIDTGGHVRVAVVVQVRNSWRFCEETATSSGYS